MNFNINDYNEIGCALMGMNFGFLYSHMIVIKVGCEAINSWVTNIEITEKNVRTLVKIGRCRWKDENEVFNVLKNHGYNMEHNYGHGEKHMAFNFYLFTLLAFSLHQIFELTG